MSAALAAGSVLLSIGVQVPASAGGPEDASQPVWMELVLPVVDTVVRGSAPWVEARGWASALQARDQDVIILIDVSSSTNDGCGVDLDGDGEVGVPFAAQHHSFHASTDPDDTVLLAEVVATDRLIHLLDTQRTRVGVMAFATRTQLVVRVGGDVEKLGRGLKMVEENGSSGQTNLDAAIRLAVDALDLAIEVGGPVRERSIIVLSDGLPSAIAMREARVKESTLAAARYAARSHSRILAFALGTAGHDEREVYAQIAEISHGAYFELDEPGDVVTQLPLLDLARIAAVQIENLTIGARGRAVRVFPDGTFDGFVPLRPGDNTIRVTARGDAGGTRALQRDVFYIPGEPSPEDTALLQELELRSLEVEMSADIERGRRQRHLVVGAEDAAPLSAVSAGPDSSASPSPRDADQPSTVE